MKKIKKLLILVLTLGIAAAFAKKKGYIKDVKKK
tara:strand:+ start:298 stop:399 length:102 start_codon:yes stop_codon:yes gene_type:complete